MATIDEQIARRAEIQKEANKFKEKIDKLEKESAEIADALRDALKDVLPERTVEIIRYVPQTIIEYRERCPDRFIFPNPLWPQASWPQGRPYEVQCGTIVSGINRCSYTANSLL